MHREGVSGDYSSESPLAVVDDAKENAQYQTCANKIILRTTSAQASTTRSHSCETVLRGSDPTWIEAVNVDRRQLEMSSAPFTRPTSHKSAYNTNSVEQNEENHVPAETQCMRRERIRSHLCNDVWPIGHCRQTRVIDRVDNTSAVCKSEKSHPHRR